MKHRHRRFADAADLKYAAFQKKLCPDTALDLWGVRLPRLRAWAKDRPGTVAELFDPGPERMLRGGSPPGPVIAYMPRRPLEEKLSWLEALLAMAGLLAIF